MNLVPLDSESGDQPTGSSETPKSGPGNRTWYPWILSPGTNPLGHPSSRIQPLRDSYASKSTPIPAGAFSALKMETLELFPPFITPLWLPFGFLWLPFGSPLASFGSFGMPLGSFLRFDENWTSLSEQMWQKRRSVVQKLASRNSSPDPPDPPEVALGPLLITPLHSRLGPG